MFIASTPAFPNVLKVEEAKSDQDNVLFPPEIDDLTVVDNTPTVGDYYPPYPYEKVFTQPDGSTFIGKIRGKEIGGGIETIDGYAVTKDISGWYRYVADELLASGKDMPAANLPPPPDLAMHIGRTRSIWCDDSGSDVRQVLWESIRERLGPMGAIGTKSYPVLLMEFSDREFAPGHNRSYFNEMIFGSLPTGSARDFFYENSYGLFNFTGEVFGPFKMSYTMAHYGTMDDAGKMAADLLPIADPVVNFKNFTSGGTEVPMVIIIHAGLDEAATGDPNDIWSNSDPGWHQSYDGVSVWAPNTCSEDTQIGTVTHESGHSLGEPDYYDTSYKTEGTGEWDTMAGGTWLGDPPSSNPAHFNPLSKINFGWASARVISSTVKGTLLEPSETHPDIVKVTLPGTTQSFLIEYKNATVGQFDRYIHSDGFVFWHFNPNAGDNSHYPNYRLDVEECDYRDGTQELELGRNRGEPTDAWCNDTTGFGPSTIPNTKSSGTSPMDSNILFCNISPKSAQMSLDIYFLPGSMDLAVEKPALSNFPAIVGRLATVTTKVYNNGPAPTYNVRVRFHDGDPAVSPPIGTDVVISSIAAHSFAHAYVNWIPERSGYLSVFAKVDPYGSIAEACEDNNVASSVFSTNLPQCMRVWDHWAPVLIVDDDSGTEAQMAFENALSDLDCPFITAPASDALMRLSMFDLVIWFTGQDREYGALSTAEISAIKTYMNNGGNFWLSSPRVASAIWGTPFGSGIDPTFFEQYFGATNVQIIQGSGFNITGMGDAVGGSGTYFVSSIGKRPMTDTVHLSSSSIGTPSAVFESGFGNLSATKVLGDSAHGNFKSLYLGFDLLQITPPSRDEIALRALNWFGLTWIKMDKNTYWLGTDRNISIKVHSTSENKNPSAIETITVDIVSTSDSTGVNVDLTESDTDSPDFTGIVNISATKNPGVLRVARNDLINVTYDDSTAGCTRYDTALVDSIEFVPFTLSLSAGWCLISMPAAVNETSVADALASISGLYDEVRWYDSSEQSDQWKSWHSKKPPSLCTLKKLNSRMGLWLHMNGPGMLSGGGYRLDVTITMRMGWNLIGYPTLNSTRTAADVFSGLPVLFLQTYSPTGKYNLRNVAMTEHLMAGQGYWVYVASDCAVKVRG